jgi:hypothetical protein
MTRVTTGVEDDRDDVSMLQSMDPSISEDGETLKVDLPRISSQVTIPTSLPSAQLHSARSYAIPEQKSWAHKSWKLSVPAKSRGMRDGCSMSGRGKCGDGGTYLGSCGPPPEVYWTSGCWGSREGVGRDIFELRDQPIIDNPWVDCLSSAMMGLETDLDVLEARRRAEKVWEDAE